MSKMADVWKPTMGINIKEIDPGIFLFQFYHREDMLLIVNGGPWSFDNAMLVVSKISPGMKPLNVPLWHLEIWIQIHDLPTGFMSEAVGKQLGDFFGDFLMYDVKNNASIWMEYMRIKIRLDVRRPLKRKKKIKRRNGTEFVVTCRYERLGEFCFSCGLVSHTDRYCRKNLERRGEEGPKDLGVWLRATPRRVANQNRSKWLRDDQDADWEARIGRDSNHPYFSGGKYGDRDKRKMVMHQSRITATTAGNKPNIMGEKGGIFQNAVVQNNELDYGLEEEENIGLNIENRKRSRNGPESKGVMDIDDNTKALGFSNTELYIDAELSNTDCSASSKQDLATLVKQASQLP